MKQLSNIFLKIIESQLEIPLKGLPPGNMDLHPQMLRVSRGISSPTQKIWFSRQYSGWLIALNIQWVMANYTGYLMGDGVATSLRQSTGEISQYFS
jgi:hypothetical protein